MTWFELAGGRDVQCQGQGLGLKGACDELRFAAGQNLCNLGDAADSLRLGQKSMKTVREDRPKPSSGFFGRAEHSSIFIARSRGRCSLQTLATGTTTTDAMCMC